MSKALVVHILKLHTVSIERHIVSVALHQYKNFNGLQYFHLPFSYSPLFFSKHGLSDTQNVRFKPLEPHRKFSTVTINSRPVDTI